MESFEDLGLGPELVEALAADGIERPTALQEAAVPVVRRANNLVIAAGPGSGVTASWAAGLLDRIDPDTDAPQVLVLTPTVERADHLAEVVGAAGSANGHSVAALGSHWVLPERQGFLFGTPADVVDALKANLVKPDTVQAVVVDQASRIELTNGMQALEQVFEYAPKEAQRIVCALPVTDGVKDFAERHLKRAVTVPAGDPSAEDGPKRGTVRFRIVPEPTEEAALELLAGLLSDDARHVLLFCRSEDRAADVGDYVTLHGYVAGAPGDTAVPVWLGVDALEARAAMEGVEGVQILSCDVPPDPDTFDRRHALSDEGMVVVRASEVPHLRATARAAGYTVVPAPPEPRKPANDLEKLQEMVRAAIEDEDTATYMVALEPLFADHDPAEVAAATVALLRKQQAATPAAATPASRPAGSTPAWAKLFLGIGETDGVIPGDLLGAITGEAGVPGESVGRIEIKDRHTLVEVHDDVAKRVIKALNGISIKGRAVRADFDRPKRGGPARGRPPRR